MKSISPPMGLLFSNYGGWNDPKGFPKWLKSPLWDSLLTGIRGRTESPDQSVNMLWCNQPKAGLLFPCPPQDALDKPLWEPGPSWRVHPGPQWRMTMAESGPPSPTPLLTQSYCCPEQKGAGSWSLRTRQGRQESSLQAPSACYVVPLSPLIKHKFKNKIFKNSLPCPQNIISQAQGPSEQWASWDCTWKAHEASAGHIWPYTAWSCDSVVLSAKLPGCMPVFLANTHKCFIYYLSLSGLKFWMMS